MHMACQFGADEGHQGLISAIAASIHDKWHDGVTPASWTPRGHLEAFVFSREFPPKMGRRRQNDAFAAIVSAKAKHFAWLHLDFVRFCESGQIVAGWRAQRLHPSRMPKK